MKRFIITSVLCVSLFIAALSPLIGNGKIIDSDGKKSTLETSTGLYQIDGDYNPGQLVLIYTDDTNYIFFVV